MNKWLKAFFHFSAVTILLSLKLDPMHWKKKYYHIALDRLGFKFAVEHVKNMSSEPSPEIIWTNYL